MWNFLYHHRLKHYALTTTTCRELISVSSMSERTLADSTGKSKKRDAWSLSHWISGIKVVSRRSRPTRPSFHPVQSRRKSNEESTWIRFQVVITQSTIVKKVSLQILKSRRSILHLKHQHTHCCTLNKVNSAKDHPCNRIHSFQAYTWDNKIEV